MMSACDPSRQTNPRVALLATLDVLHAESLNYNLDCLRKPELVKCHIGK